ncbi:hypothetical protein NPIL_183231 [Nephila pilipes]|uniref:Uncharacterized protein n=1 Tax=Nephila pilipes TaxID=299642 RepID=A0A8X6N4T0_NEPPI|nr:hypothetical protein NPIL_183231 [Nephila pilipes]
MYLWKNTLLLLKTFAFRPLPPQGTVSRPRVSYKRPPSAPIFIVMKMCQGIMLVILTIMRFISSGVKQVVMVTAYPLMGGHKGLGLNSYWLWNVLGRSLG